MNEPPHVSIRTSLRPEDLDKIILLHRHLYADEFGYGKGFENHVVAGLHEFYNQYDVARDRVWICEAENDLIGFLLLMHRGNESAQLRFFVLRQGYRGQGLGNKLMGFFTAFMKEAGYSHAYLWTTSELQTAAALYKKYGFRLTVEKATSSFGKEVIEQRYDLYL
jgi:peptidyl-dipeptidase Dcp